MNLFGEEKMLALSWKQPFGSAMLVDKVETRVWATKYRGLVLICLSKAAYSEATARAICGDEQFGRICNALASVENTLDLNGMAIAVGRLVDCREMKPEDEETTFVQYRSPWIEEREGKDGRIRKVSMRLYCHFYENVRTIIPFPWRGSQGWMEVPQDVRKAISFTRIDKPENFC